MNHDAISLRRILKKGPVYGFFSQKSYDSIGICDVYLDANGQAVRVTQLNDSPTYDEYKWEDKICLGELTKFLGPANTLDGDAWIARDEELDLLWNDEMEHIYYYDDYIEQGHDDYGYAM